MGGRRNEKKREMKKEFRAKGGKEKKKSSAGFKLVRLVLLVSCLCSWRGWLEGLVSLFSLPGPHSSLLFSLQSPLTLQLPSAGCSAFVLESYNAALGTEVLGLWVEQLTSAPDALGGFRCGRPSGVSCVCPQFACTQPGLR